jgi:16S rRNA (cytosine967-C5)-methyltransferase
VFTGTFTQLHDLLSSRHDVWPQDDASAGAVESLAGLKPKMILDLCAGRGTKTRQLAQIFPNAQIAATDADDRRLEVLRKTFAGHGRVTAAGMRATTRGNVGKADLILLDVPCSNSGVLARRPEARYRADDAHLASLVDIQRQIIADSISLLAPGGRILYATCSLEPEENEQQGQWAAKWHNFACNRERRITPSGTPGGPPTAYADGAYSVLLEPGSNR